MNKENESWWSQPPTDRSLAYHEAGHAVVALSGDHFVNEISILQGESDGIAYLGKCEYDQSQAVSPDQSSLEALAGAVAQCIEMNDDDLTLAEYLVYGVVEGLVFEGDGAGGCSDFNKLMSALSLLDIPMPDEGVETSVEWRKEFVRPRVERVFEVLRRDIDMLRDIVALLLDRKTLLRSDIDGIGVVRR